MFGFAAFAVLPFATVPFVSVSPVIFDFHDGGERRKSERNERKNFAKKQAAQRKKIIDLFEQIVEGKPKIAEEIAESFVVTQATKQAQAIIDYDAMLSNLDRVNKIYSTIIDMDDEEVLLLI
jgi:hypothetical protein